MIFIYKQTLKYIIRDNKYYESIYRVGSKYSSSSAEHEAKRIKCYDIVDGNKFHRKKGEKSK